MKLFKMDDENLNAPVAAEVNLKISKNPIGSSLEGGEFTFGLFDGDTELRKATNNPHGLVTFATLMFTSAGVHHYTIREIETPGGCWDMDETEYPVEITITNTDQSLIPTVYYPMGVPGFKNVCKGEECSLIEFPELTFDAPGEYVYKLKELTPSGNGWTTDDSEFEVVITVIDDGYGNLIATMDFPDEFPVFENTYSTKPAHIVISAKKIAIGAKLPCGKFEFALIDEAGEIVARTTNG